MSGTLDLSTSPHSVPPDTDPKLWDPWLKGTKFYDKLWAAGKRCPTNQVGDWCCCATPTEEICRTYHALKEIAKGLGPWAVKIVEGL